MLSIADRRTIATKTMTHADFRGLMRSDPRSAVKRAIDHAIPDDIRITVIEEQPRAWAFVVPSQPIDA